MDAERPDDLTDLEQRLSALRPSTDGLAADAMLFAAGRASARSGGGRYAWPAVAGGLAVLAAALGGWVASERGERLALAQQLREHKPAPISMPAPAPELASAPRLKPSPNSLLAAHLALEHDFDAWLAGGAPATETPPGPTLPSRPVPRAWQPGAAPDQWH